MDDNQFLQSLHSRFVDVKVPESLLPEHVAERLKKKPRVTIVENTKRFVAVAAIFAIIVISSILTIGPILIDSADFSIEPAQNSDSYELQ